MNPRAGGQMGLRPRSQPQMGPLGPGWEWAGAAASLPRCPAGDSCTGSLYQTVSPRFEFPQVETCMCTSSL